jgi:hypothetical protein
MRKLLTVGVALLMIALTPVEAQAIAPCSNSQNYVIRSAQSAVTAAQRNLSTQQGYVRLATITFNASQSSLKSAQRKYDQLNATLNRYFAEEKGANRVKLLDLQIAEERVQKSLDVAERALRLAESAFDRSQSNLGQKQDGVSRVQQVLDRKQSELARQQAKCSR